MDGFKQEEGMLDFAQFLNVDHVTSVTGSQAQNGKTIVAPQFTAPGPENAFIQPQHTSQQFQGPSHNYELFRQHSSLPPGAMQSAMQRPRNMMQSISGNSLYDISEADGNFNSMELDFNDFLNNNTPLDGYVDPNSIGSDIGDASPVAAPVQRLYPGMHQQAAKAQQEQQRRLQEQQKALAQRQQQQQQQQQQQIGHQRRTSQGRNKHSDPLVEERISQILKQMRASSQNARPPPSGSPQPVLNQSARQRKEEEDMDEDERLLASEEGKKLSSKERRQLRNKVSARAFRSRRKEYISQLEGEINGKNSENDELRYDNDLLRTENAQLTDLARMLLGHPAFGSVLEDLSSRGAQMPFLDGQANTQPQPQAQGQHRASIAMSQASTQGSNSQANSGMDFANTPISGWNNGMDAAEFNFNPSVFAVVEVPTHPEIAPEVLAGKAADIILPPPSLSLLPSLNEKENKPVIEHLPELTSSKVDRPIISTFTPASMEDDLYADDDRLPAPAALEKKHEITATVTLEKPVAHFELVVCSATADQEVSTDRLDAIVSRLDELSSRLSKLGLDI